MYLVNSLKLQTCSNKTCLIHYCFLQSPFMLVNLNSQRLWPNTILFFMESLCAIIGKSFANYSHFCLQNDNAGKCISGSLIKKMSPPPYRLGPLALGFTGVCHCPLTLLWELSYFKTKWNHCKSKYVFSHSRWHNSLHIDLYTYSGMWRRVPLLVHHRRN